MKAYLQIDGQCCRIARAYNLFGLVAIGIAAIHPPTGVVVLASFVDNIANVGAFATFVAGTPEQYSGLVAIAKHHSAHAFAIHAYEAFVAGYIFGGMCLYTCLIDDIKAIASGIFQVAWCGWIVADAHGVEAIAFQYLHVLLDELVCYAVTIFGVLHVRILCIYLEWLAVEQEYIVHNFCLLKSYILAYVFHSATR